MASSRALTTDVGSIDSDALRRMSLTTMALDTLAKRGKFDEIRFLLEKREDALALFLGWLSGLGTGLLATPLASSRPFTAALLQLVQVAAPMCDASHRRSLLEACSALRIVAADLAELLKTRAFELHLAPGGASSSTRTSPVRATDAAPTEVECEEDGACADGAGEHDQSPVPRSSNRQRAPSSARSHKRDTDLDEYVPPAESESDSASESDEEEISKRKKHKKSKKSKKSKKRKDDEEDEEEEDDDDDEEEYNTEDEDEDEDEQGDDDDDESDIEGDGTDMDGVITGMVDLEQKVGAQETSITNLQGRTAAVEAAAVATASATAAAAAQHREMTLALETRIEQLERQMRRLVQPRTPPAGRPAVVAPPRTPFSSTRRPRVDEPSSLPRAEKRASAQHDAAAPPTADARRCLTMPSAAAAPSSSAEALAGATVAPATPMAIDQPMAHLALGHSDPTRADSPPAVGPAPKRLH